MGNFSITVIKRSDMAGIGKLTNLKRNLWASWPQNVIVIQVAPVASAKIAMADPWIIIDTISDGSKDSYNTKFN